MEVRGERGAQPLLWVYPLRGLVLAPPHPKAFLVRTKAKTSARAVLELPLRSLGPLTGPETFGYELEVPPNMQRLVDQSLAVRACAFAVF